MTDKYNFDSNIVEYLIETYQPDIECVKSAGKCDFRCGKDDDKCPCQQIIELQKKIENERLREMD